jgi:hypothetical protein
MVRFEENLRSGMADPGNGGPVQWHPAQCQYTDRINLSYLLCTAVPTVTKDTDHTSQAQVDNYRRSDQAHLGTLVTN